MSVAAKKRAATLTGGGPRLTAKDKALIKSQSTDPASHESLAVMLDAVKRDAEQFFSMGEMRAQKKLPNGAVVTLKIRMPPLR